MQKGILGALAAVVLVATAIVVATNPEIIDRLKGSVTGADLAPTRLPGYTAYISAISGEKQGVIHGSVLQRGREGWIAAYAISENIDSPRDPASGMATGKRMHKPFVVTKEIDKSSPKLLNALARNEVLKAVQVDVFGVRPDGIEAKFYTITMQNAAISSYEMGEGAEGKRMPLEQIAFVYQTITWTWVDGGITATDVWEAPTY